MGMLQKIYSSNQFRERIEKARNKANKNLIDSGDAFTYTPISYRTYDKQQDRNEKGQFTKSSTISNERIADEKVNSKTEATLPVKSTAIASARYDPSDDSLNIKYTSGEKEYKFKAGGKEGLEEYLNAPSKGRLTNEWRTTHHYPGY